MSLLDKRGWTKQGRCKSGTDVLKRRYSSQGNRQEYSSPLGETLAGIMAGEDSTNDVAAEDGKSPIRGRRSLRLNGIVADMLRAWGVRDDKHWAIER
jgi:hypothetical protein